MSQAKVTSKLHDDKAWEQQGRRVNKGCEHAEKMTSNGSNPKVQLYAKDESCSASDEKRDAGDFTVNQSPRVAGSAGKVLRSLPRPERGSKPLERTLNNAEDEEEREVRI